MPKDLNKIQLIGRLGADPELRYTPQGAAVCTFNVATGRSYKTSDGEQRDETEWHSLVAWNKLGEICNQYLAKGSRVYIEGRLKTEKWQDKETGQDRYRTTVVVNDMIILDGRNQGGYSADENADTDETEPVSAPATPRAAQNRNGGTQSQPAQRGPQNGAQRGQPARSSAPARRNVPQAIADEDLPF